MQKPPFLGCASFDSETRVVERFRDMCQVLHEVFIKIAQHTVSYCRRNDNGAACLRTQRPTIA